MGRPTQGGAIHKPLRGADFNFTAHDSTGNSRIFFSSADFPYYVEPTYEFLSVANAVNYSCYDAVTRYYATCAPGTWWLACGQYGCYAGLKFSSTATCLQSTTLYRLFRADFEL